MLLISTVKYSSVDTFLDSKEETEWSISGNAAYGTGRLGRNTG